MANKTNIEWTERTWNPVTGCTKLSAGCAHCYAERMAARQAGRNGYPVDRPFQPAVVHEDKLRQPKFPRTPAMIFVSSMGDLFHDDVSDDVRDRVFAVMAAYPQHLFQTLTKRAANLRRYASTRDWPKNVWAGATIESQDNIDRLTDLAQVNAPVRFVSVEPMLSAVDLAGHPAFPAVSWVICGGETGPCARPCHIEWVRNLRDQCQTAGLPFFLKKLSDGSNTLDGCECHEYPTGTLRLYLSTLKARCNYGLGECNTNISMGAQPTGSVSCREHAVLL